MDLHDKVVVITGGGSGIGRAAALALAAAGCHIVVADRNDAAAKQTATDVELTGRRALAVVCDVTSDQQVQDLAARTFEQFEAVDILWNHAGSPIAGPPERIPVERWRHLLDLNVLGGVRGMLAFLPSMIERGSGHILFTTSGLGLFPDSIPGLAAPYVTSKAAQIGLARTLAPYLRPRGIGVSLLAPDITATAHTFEIPTVDLDPALLAANLDMAAIQQPEDVAVRLVQGLRADEFLISMLPRTREQLVEAAERLYEMPPASSSPVVQYVRIEADPAKHDQLAAVLAQAAQVGAADPGNRSFQFTADLTRRGVFHAFEEWDDAASLEQHAATPASQALLARMGEFGISGLTTRVYTVDAVDGDRIDAS